MVPIALIRGGSASRTRTPRTPFSSTVRAISASSVLLTAAMIRSERATRFSRGITRQSPVSTMTYPLPASASASARDAPPSILTSKTSVPQTRSPSSETTDTLPSAFTGDAEGAMTTSAPLSSAVVTSSFLKGRTSTQNSFIGTPSVPRQGQPHRVPPCRGPRQRTGDCPAGTRSFRHRPLPLRLSPHRGWRRGSRGHRPSLPLQ